MRTAWACAEAASAIAHPRVELRKMDMLHLRGAAAGQLVIQMLSGAAEGLPRPLGFGTQDDRRVDRPFASSSC